MKKKLLGLTLITICLLSCIGITYAAHYTDIYHDNTIFEEGDTFQGLAGEVNAIDVVYFTPMYENGEPDYCKYKIYNRASYSYNKAYTIPELEENDYIWAYMGQSWEYNCEYPKFYVNYDDTIEEKRYSQVVSRDNVNLFAYPKLQMKLECEDKVLEKDSKIKCEIKLNSAVKFISEEMVLDTGDLEIEDFQITHNKFAYDETANKITGTIGFGGEVLENITIATFNLTTKENLTGEKKISIRLKDIIYSDKVVDDYKLNDVEEEITLKGKEVITTTSKTTTTTTSKKEEVENPKTGVEDYLIVLAFILPFAGITLYYLKDRGLFKGL